MKEISLLMRKFNPPPNKNGYEAESITLSDFSSHCFTFDL